MFGAKNHLSVEKHAWRWGRLLAGIVVAGVIGSGFAVGISTPASAAVKTIGFEAPRNETIALGSLASRSQGKSVYAFGVGPPYTVFGLDSNTGNQYSLVTDFNYGDTNPDFVAAWRYESDERAPVAGISSFASDTTSMAIHLASEATCALTASPDNPAANCSSFGPHVYTEAFDATVGQAVSFDWRATAGTDNYEIYVYLVRVEDGKDYADADQTLVAYGRGRNQDWTTVSPVIPANGTYRLHFVNGSYDSSGGRGIGSGMDIRKPVKLGLDNPITFGTLKDRVRGSGPFTVSATAPGGAVTFTSNTPLTCTVSGTTVTLPTVTGGQCTLVAHQAGGGEYVPADPVASSFTVLFAPTSPENLTRPFFEGAPGVGNTVTANEGTWYEGGLDITNTIVEWRDLAAGGAFFQQASCYLVASPGNTITIRVTKFNSWGSSSALSEPLTDYACGAPTPVAPAWPGPNASLGSAVTGESFNATFTATGVSAPTYSLVVGEGDLPEGLALDEVTGVVSGTPAISGPYSFVIRATNPTGTADLAVSGTVNAAPGVISGTLGTLVVGTEVTGKFVHASGTPAPTYSLSEGALPPGLQLDSATGEFSGTPTAAGPYEFTVTAGNGVGAPATRDYTGTVYAAPGWATSSGGLDAVVGTPVDVTFTGSGAPAPSYSISDGALPDGLTLESSNGRITGTPTATGNFAFTITATNDYGSANLEISSIVTEAPGRITGGPNEFVVGRDASGSVHAPGTPAPTYEVTAGVLPAGVSLNAATGTFSGTPTSAGPYEFTVTAGNGVGAPATRDYTGTVYAGPSWPLSTAPHFIVGTTVNLTFIAAGTPDLDYAIIGPLPAGLTFDIATGALTGTPTTAGQYAFVVRAQNDYGSADYSFTGTVDEAPSAITGGPDAFVVGNAAGGSVHAAGTPAPSYTVTVGDLPVGVTLDAETGEFGGTPAAAGDYEFTITAANGIGEITRTFTGTVEEAPTWVQTPVLDLEVGAGVTATFHASGTPAPDYKITEGQLPGGLSLDEATGTVAGTPTTHGAYSFTITAANGVGDPVNFLVTGTVVSAPQWITESITTTTADHLFSDVLVASGTPAPWYSIAAGALPAGLTLDETTGAITGTPTKAGPYAFTVAASNGVGNPALREFSGTVTQAAVSPTAPVTPQLSNTGSNSRLLLRDAGLLLLVGLVLVGYGVTRRGIRH